MPNIVNGSPAMIRPYAYMQAGHWSPPIAALESPHTYVPSDYPAQPLPIDASWSNRKNREDQGIVMDQVHI